MSRKYLNEMMSLENAKMHIINVVIIGISVLLPHSGLLPNFTYSIPILAAIWLGLRYSGESFADLGLRWKNLSWKAMFVGTLSAIVIIAFMQLVFFPLLETFVQFEAGDTSIYDFARSNIWNLAFLIFMGWIIGGFYEELVFHGFMFTRIEKMVKGRYATFISIASTSLIFGAYHLQLGWASAINALIVGAVYISLFLYFKRNLWYAIICHGMYDTIVFILVYNGYLI